MEKPGFKLRDEATLSKFVTLVSQDGYEFVVPRESTKISPAISSMLDPSSTNFRARNIKRYFPQCMLANVVITL